MSVSKLKLMAGDAEPDFKRLVDCVCDAYEHQQTLYITGDNSKSFYGPTCDATNLSTKDYQGIVSYEPSELVITVKAGTRIQEVLDTLAEQNQMLSFEPPVFSANSTIGGVIAAGLAGPRRPYAGSARDYVLGVQCINGRGELLGFGGQVIKNVAGYDLSRLLTGSFGTLALMTEISLRVAPSPDYEISCVIEMPLDEAYRKLQEWILAGIPISASAFYQQQFMLRISGKRSSLESIQKKWFPENTQELSNSYWQQLNELRLEFFTQGDLPLWCLHVPVNHYDLKLPGESLRDWGGSRIWLRTDQYAEQIRQRVSSIGGHADLIVGATEKVEHFHPLPPALYKYHQRIKQAFDPKAILNPGRMYQSL